MRFYELKGLSDKEANELIIKCPQAAFKEVLDRPGDFSKKVLVFRGNYDGFATNRLCARIFRYILEEDKWEVADVTVYDMFISGFYYHFSTAELESEFKDFYNGKGFVMDA